MSTQPPILDPHPGVCANRIMYYVSGRLRAGTINLLSAYLLMHEHTRLNRRCYLLPAWQETLGICGLLDLYYDYLMGRALKSFGEAAEAAEWFASDLSLLQERRPHFLVDRLPQGSSLLEDRSFYELLSALRRDDDHLSEDDGPFPTQVFPYHFAAPERELLNPGSEAQFQPPLEIDAESADLYVQLQINA